MNASLGSRDDFQEQACCSNFYLKVTQNRTETPGIEGFLHHRGFGIPRCDTATLGSLGQNTGVFLLFFSPLFFKLGFKHKEWSVQVLLQPPAELQEAQVGLYPKHRKCINVCTPHANSVCRHVHRGVFCTLSPEEQGVKTLPQCLPWSPSRSPQPPLFPRPPQ